LVISEQSRAEQITTLAPDGAKAKEKADTAAVDVQDFLSGARTDWKNAYKNPEIWNQVKSVVPEMPSLPMAGHTIKSVVKTAVGDQGNVTGLPELNSLKEGSAINYNGKYFIVEPKELDETGKDYVIYKFTSMDDGKPYYIRLGKASGAKNAQIKTNDLATYFG
jgi:hypothetical protein